MSYLEYLRIFPFLIPLVVLLLSEITKITVTMMRSGTWHEKLFQAGGMPSTHSAFVMSLLIVVGRKLGFESTEFAIAFVFACVVWYDAMGSRKALGEQAKILNRLQHWQRLTERLGHSFVEVVAGILFGAAITMLGIAVST